MRRYNYEITVKGRGEFPIDMLRYSQCYPMDAESVENIQHRAQYNAPRAVTVCLSNAPHGLAANCVARFASFGWAGEITLEKLA